MIHKLIKLKCKDKIYYTYEHWHTMDDCWTAVLSKPSHSKTQVVVYVPIDECEVLETVEEPDITGYTPLYAAPVSAEAIQHCPCCGSDYFAGSSMVDLDKAIKNDPLYLQGRAELEQVSNHLSDAEQLIQRMMKEKEAYEVWQDKTEWVDLTDDEIYKISGESSNEETFARAVIAAFKEKNK